MSIAKDMIVVEGKNVIRDPLLFGAPFLPLGVALLCRFLVPFITGLLDRHFSFDLAAHYPLIASIFLFYSPIVYAVIVGFNLLDEKDEELLQYIAVTPLGKTGYIGYKLLFPVVISIVSTFFTLWILNLVEIHFWQVLPVIVVASLEAPIFTVILTVVAENKVEGMAYAKASAVLYIPVFVGYLVSSPYQLAAGILPTYWITQAYLTIFDKTPILFTSNDYVFYLLGGVLVHIVYLLMMVKMFLRRER